MTTREPDSWTLYRTIACTRQLCASFLIGVCLLVPSMTIAESAIAKPNILFIAIDDLRPELGCYGQDHVISPNIDRLSRTGVTFTRAYCQQAVCNPSRASLMTGLRPDTLKVWDLRTSFRDTRPDVVTVAQHFKQQGYHTTAIGKIFHNNLPDDASWSEPKLHVDGYPFDPDAVYRKSENIDWLEERKSAIVQEGKQARYIDRFGKWYLKYVATENIDVPDDAYFDGVQTTVAVKKLAELKAQGKPFFFGVGYYRPHLPFNVPEKYWNLYDRETIPLASDGEPPRDAPLMAVNTIRELRGYADFRGSPTPDKGPLTEAQQRLLKHGYLASVSYIDAQVGRLLDALDALELAENTIVVLWGDHGWKLGEHGSWCKMTNYEIDTRVPLIVRAPGKKANGQSCHRLVEFVDLYPALCELAGLPAVEELEGTSFAPLLNDTTRPWKSAVFSQFLRTGIWIAPDGIEYMGYSVRTDRFRYVRWVDWKTGKFAAEELYDHREDSSETHNIAGRNQQIVQRMRSVLEAGWTAAKPNDQ